MISKHEKYSFTISVPYFYCACTAPVSKNFTETALKIITDGVIARINSILAIHSNSCAEIKLGNVTNMQEFNLKDVQASGHVELSLLEVSFSTLPCNAEFETFVVLNTTSKEPDFSKLEIGNFRRTNMYGLQSACIDDKLKRIFCCCHNYLKSS